MRMKVALFARSLTKSSRLSARFRDRVAPNYKAAFRKTGFESISVPEPAFIAFRGQRLREADGLREIWDINVQWKALVASIFSSPKFTAAQHWRSFLLRPKSRYRFRCLLAHIPNRYQWNQIFIRYPDSFEIANVWNFSTKHPISQRRSYSCDETSMRRADQDISPLLTKFLPSRDENHIYPSQKLFATPCCLDLKINVFDFFHIYGVHIFTSILSDFDQWICMAWIIDFSFN
jgi:hypothetical protein